MQLREGAGGSRNVESKAPLMLGVLGGAVDGRVAAGCGLQKALLSRPSAEGRSNNSVRVKLLSSRYQSASERAKARVQP